MTKYKAVFIDIDGTIRNDSKDISLRTKQLISRLVKENIFLVITTGRPLSYTIKVSKDALASNYIIASNGGIIYDYNNAKTIYQENLSHETVIKLYELAVKLGIIVRLNVDDPNITYVNCNNVTSLKDYNITQVIYICQNVEVLMEASTIINNMEDVEVKNQSKYLLNRNLPKPQYPYLDIDPKSVSKGDGVKRLCDYLNINLEETITIGDDENDISMLSLPGLSVAMGNASEKIKNIADIITDTNNQEGVYQALDKIFPDKKDT